MKKIGFLLLLTGCFWTTTFASSNNSFLQIEDEAGILVYRQTFSVTDGLQIVIPVSDGTSGVYTIEFINPEGQYLEGSFEIE